MRDMGKMPVTVSEKPAAHAKNGNKKPAEAGFFGAVEKTRTSTGCPTATSTLRVYQFRHDRIVVEPNCSGGLHVAKALGGHKSDVTDFSPVFTDV
jgi:hypothetical protein